MAPGYVLAIGFEAAGIAVFAIGLLALHLERRAKASGLRRVLISGHAPEHVAAGRPLPPPSAPLPASPEPRRRPVPDSAPRRSEALDALRRAFARQSGLAASAAE